MTGFDQIAVVLPGLMGKMVAVGACAGFLPIVLVTGLCSVIEVFKGLVK